MTLLCASLFLSACSSEPRISPHHLSRGEYADARVAIADKLPDSRKNRRYLLDRMKLCVLTLADGYPQAAQGTFEEVYDVLRTQGINKDKTVQSVVINEDLKFWKGEPFEQALAFFYYSLQQAELNRWDNARAAAQNSLFQLKDFTKGGDPDRVSEVEGERAQEGDSPDHGYAPRESNFALGYLLNGIANQQLGRADEANDNFNAAVQFNPQLRDVADELRTGKYNTILVVAYGLGPEKVLAGMDGELARFEPRTLTDNRHLVVSMAGQSRRYPLGLDVNVMAQDHLWNNLEGVRKVKSGLGTGLLVGGLGAAAVGAGAGSQEAAIAGLGAAALGAFLKAGAHADVAFCDAYPQRMYVVPLQIDDPNTTVDLQVDGAPSSRLVLAGLGPPADRSGGAQLRYVNLVGGGVEYAFDAAPRWATSGQIFYGNDRTGPAEEYPLPWILGGRDVRQPGPATSEQYRAAGLVLTPAELENLYRLEGVRWQVEGESSPIKHVLEGGDSLVPPLVGTTGFARIFGQERPAYQPRSEEVRATADRVRGVAPSQPPQD